MPPKAGPEVRLQLLLLEDLFHSDPTECLPIYKHPHFMQSQSQASRAQPSSISFAHYCTQKACILLSALTCGVHLRSGTRDTFRRWPQSYVYGPALIMKLGVRTLDVVELRTGFTI